MLSKLASEFLPPRSIILVTILRFLTFGVAMCNHCGTTREIIYSESCHFKCLVFSVFHPFLIDCLLGVGVPVLFPILGESLCFLVFTWCVEYFISTVLFWWTSPQ